MAHSRTSVLVFAFLASTAWGVPADDLGNPLCNAANRGDLRQVRALLDQGADPNVRDRYSETALMIAATLPIRGSLEGKSDPAALVKLLLERGANPNLPDDSGRSALILAMSGTASEHAVLGASPAIVRLLLEHGADVNVRDREGRSPLTMLADQLAPRPEVMQLLVDRGADVSASTKNGRTALMLAAHYGKTAEVAVLLKSGATRDAADRDGTTALMEAAESEWDRDHQVLKRLLAEHANADTRDRRGRTALDRAAAAGYPDKVDLLSVGASAKGLAAARGRARNRALLRVSHEEGEPAVKTLLGQGADPNFSGEYGETALLLAIERRYFPGICRLLLDRGASANAADRAGDTPLLLAAKVYQPELVRMLLAAHADVEARDHEGNTPLLRAAASTSIDLEPRKQVIRILLDHGADPRVSNAQGSTALMLAVRRGAGVAAETLLTAAPTRRRQTTRAAPPYSSLPIRAIPSWWNCCSTPARM
jgi:ankyrin repeat protein